MWEESCVGGIPCGRNPVWEESHVGGILCGRNPMGGIPCGRNPVWEESYGRNPVWEESCVGGILLGGIPWEESRLGGILLGGIPWEESRWEEFHDYRFKYFRIGSTGLERGALKGIVDDFLIEYHFAKFQKMWLLSLTVRTAI